MSSNSIVVEPCDAPYHRLVIEHPDIWSAGESVMPDVVAIEVTPLAGGSSAFVAQLSLTSVDGDQRRVVFRQHADRAGKEQTELVASKEFHLTRKLADAGVDVARPLALHGANTSDGPWLVTEWIEGTTAVASSELDAALAQMARFLRRLHAIESGYVDAPGMGEIEDPVQALPRYLAGDETGRAVADALQRGVRRRPNRSVLLHGDFWPGNVMFEHGELVAVLDWEDACWGDPLVDLACARVELTCAYGAGACERFTAGYLDDRRNSSMQIDLTDLALWDVYVSATALRSMHLWGLSPDDERVRRRTTGRFLEAGTARLVPNASG